MVAGGKSSPLVGFCGPDDAFGFVAGWALGDAGFKVPRRDDDPGGLQSMSVGVSLTVVACDDNG